MDDSKEVQEFPSDKDDEETKDLQQFCSLVSEVTNKVYDTVQDIAASDSSVKSLRAATKETYEKFDNLVPLMLESKNEHDETSSKALYIKWRNAEKQREKDQAEIKQLKRQILSHSDYCSNVGAVLGSLVWRASFKPEIVNTWLSERRDLKKLEELLSITNRAIESFFKTYDDVLPPLHRDEYQFPMGLLGTVSNITASSEGRQFLIENTDGRNLLKNLVTYLPRIPTDSSGKLKKLILVVLWNMCVNEEGLRYLFDVQVGQVVLYCLNDPNAEKLKFCGLNILQSITHNLTEPRLLNDLLKCVPMTIIRNLAIGERDSKVAKLAREVLDHLTKLEKSVLRSKNDS